MLGLKFTLNTEPPTVVIPELKRAAKLKEIDDILYVEKRLAPDQAGSLRGSLQWMLSYLFEQSGRADLAALADRQYERGMENETFRLNGNLIESLLAIRKIVEKAIPHHILPRQIDPQHAVLYTDGAQNDFGMGIGGILIDPVSRVKQWWGGEVPPLAYEQWAKRKNNILNIELYAVYVSLRVWGKYLTNKRVVAFIDNTAAFACLCKAPAFEKDTRTLVRSIVKLYEKLHIAVWFEWIESKANPADWPSRLLYEYGDIHLATKQRLDALSLREMYISRFPGYGNAPLS